MMKTIWTILGTMVAASLLAQNNTNSLPPMPPPVSSPAAETAPATPPAANTSTIPAPTPPKHKKPHKPVAKKKTEKAETTTESSVTLAPGPAEVNASDLVVRGQAGLKGELVTHLHKGDTVTVLEQINLSKHEADEPSQWAKISFPTNAHLWVDSKFVDASGAVTSKKLNMRAGPGENYSVAGVLEKGTQVTKIETKGNWIKIEPPANAYAFVAAKFLTQQAAQTAVAANPPEAPEAQPTQTQVPEQPQIVTTPPPAPPQQQPLIPPVRIVSHEGVVGTVGSPTAPTTYKIYDPETKQDIDFLYPINANVNLDKLVDSRVIVTGEEGVDQRWPNTPIIAVQSVEILQTDAVKRFSKQDLTPPRQRH